MIISFLDDDIDKPYVSGSLYNGVNDPLVSLPHHDHKTSISSKTIGLYEQGYNELTLSNLKDKEQIYLKAERDYDELVQHNFTQRILNDKDSKVDGIYNERIKKVHTQTIDLAKNVNVGGEYLINVGLSKDTIVGLSNTLNVGVDNKVRVTKNSSEYIGENKDIEIGANQNTIIHKDEIRNV
ncbi:VgrG protein, partial [Campylobacter coli]|nr:VgrG protein [Campylobacter coli]